MTEVYLRFLCAHYLPAQAVISAVYELALGSSLSSDSEIMRKLVNAQI